MLELLTKLLTDDKLIAQGAGFLLCLFFMAVMLWFTLPAMTRKFGEVLGTQQAAAERILDRQHVDHRETLAIVVTAGKESITALSTHLAARMDLVSAEVAGTSQAVGRLEHIVVTHLTGEIAEEREPRGPRDYTDHRKGAA